MAKAMLFMTNTSDSEGGAGKKKFFEIMLAGGDCVPGPPEHRTKMESYVGRDW